MGEDVPGGILFYRLPLQLLGSKRGINMNAASHHLPISSHPL